VSKFRCQSNSWLVAYVVTVTTYGASRFYLAQCKNQAGSKAMAVTVFFLMYTSAIAAL
jgi:hypothetical protein